MKSLLKVTASTGMLTLVKMIMGFIVAKFVAITTGPSGIALLGQIQTIVAALTGVVNSPSTVAVVRFTAEDYHNDLDKCSKWWKASVNWTLLLLLLTISPGILFSKQISLLLLDNKEYYWLIYVIALSLPLSAIGNFLLCIVNGQREFKTYVLLGMVSSIVSGLIMLAMIYKYNIIGALLAGAIQSAIIGLIILLANIKKPWFKISLFIGIVDIDKLKGIGAYISMSLFSALSLPLALLFVRNILVDYVGWEKTGEWQAVWKISEVYLGVITVALGTYFLPNISKLNTLSEIKKATNDIAKVIIPIVTILAVIVYLLRDFVITILFTKEFFAARELFLIQLMGDVIKIVGWIYAYALLAKGIVRPFIILEIIFSASFIMSTLIFVPKFGVEGANYAYILSYTIYLGATILVVKNLTLR